jgi:hypothetical protein
LTKCNVIIVAHTYSMIFNNEYSLKWIWNSPLYTYSNTPIYLK